MPTDSVVSHERVAEADHEEWIHGLRTR
jgi:hypothetical protein